MNEQDLAVRAARAELERDQAITRAERAEEAWRALMSSPEKMLETLHVMGIPASDLKDIYRIVNEWERNGGRPELLELYRELESLRGAAV